MAGLEQFITDVVIDEVKPEGQTGAGAIAWGEVIQAEPLLVKMVGETTANVSISLKNADLVPIVGDKLFLVKIGRSWAAICRLN